MRVLVTGPTGAVGQYILEGLMTTGHEVRVLALPDSLHRCNFRDRIDLVPGDLADRQALEEAVDGVEVVFHAAVLSPPPARRVEEMQAVNVDGLRALLSACAGRVGRLLLVSSNNVYAPHRSPATWPVRDDAPREAHGSPQQAAVGETLIAAEDLLQEAAARGEVACTILRPTQVAGRKCPFIEGMIVSLIRERADVGALRRMWDVMQWVHGSDLGRAAILAATHPDARNQCFVVAGDEPATIHDVQRIMWDVMHPGRDGNPHADLASRSNLGLPKFSSAKLRALGWSPRVPMRQCVAEVLGRLEFYSSAALGLPDHLLDG